MTFPHSTVSQTVESLSARLVTLQNLISSGTPTASYSAVAGNLGPNGSGLGLRIPASALERFSSVQRKIKALFEERRELEEFLDRYSSLYPLLTSLNSSPLYPLILPTPPSSSLDAQSLPNCPDSISTELLPVESQYEIVKSALDDIDETVAYLRKVAEASEILDKLDLKDLPTHISALAPIENRFLTLSEKHQKLYKKMMSLIEYYGNTTNALSEVFIDYDNMLSSIETQLNQTLKRLESAD